MALSHPMQTTATGSSTVSASRLSSLSTSTLSSILELTRAHQLSLPCDRLRQQVSKNLQAVRLGLEVLQQEQTTTNEDDDDDDTKLNALTTLKALQQQYDRLCDLSQPLGVEVVRRQQPEATLVDTRDESSDDQDLLSQNDTRHTTVHINDSTTRRELDRLDQDEHELDKANEQVMQMQQRIMEDQDDTLNSLSSAIQRQHDLSLHISSELELQSTLLDDTDQAIERTDSNLRRASNRLNQFTKKAKSTGSTGLIVTLVVLLIILILLFRL
ncbi:hypothetical protein OIO90_003250 [Microbotryomycetes sp. JL221]|nr:hypothetical protein OIO90_003250 [Microbotryomycetes sp. JL221]